MIWLLLIPAAIYGLLYVGSPLGSTTKSQRSLALDSAAAAIFQSPAARKLLFGDREVEVSTIREKLVTRTLKGLQEAADLVRPSAPEVATAITSIIEASS